MTTKTELQTFTQELYPELLDRVQETQDVLAGLAKFLSEDPPLTRERLQKPEELPETDQDVREAGESVRTNAVSLISSFQSMYENVLDLPSSGDYTSSKTTIESAYLSYVESHNEVIAHLRETVTVNGISRQPDILETFTETSDELSDRPEQAREFRDGEIPPTLKETALTLITALNDQIDSTKSSWESI
mgnify:CR=1 FL=1